MFYHVVALICSWLRLANAVASISSLYTSPGYKFKDTGAIHRHADAYYSSRAGNAARSNSFPFTPPTDFSSGPSWVWPNELIEQVRHSPLIDHNKNIYVTTTSMIRKFTPDGDIKWTYMLSHDEGLINSSPSLYDGAIIVLANKHGDPTAISINMDSGKENWRQLYNNTHHNSDASSLSVFNDIIFFGAMRDVASGPPQGNNVVVAASALNGSHLWDYMADDVFWNFSPSTPGDHTLIFASSCGIIFRISFDGSLIWRNGKSLPGKYCSCGGGALGPNGVFYAEYSTGDGDIFNKKGIVAAHRITDGHRLWKKHFDLPGFQYPAVGMLGNDGPLAVVVALGHNPANPVNLAAEMNFLAAGRQMNNSVVALDAMTGDTLWHSEEEPWHHSFAAGDEEMPQKHNNLMLTSPPSHYMSPEGGCWPDNQGIPMIASDGTVYASSSHSGVLRAIRDSDHNGIIEPLEVSTFETHYCFLNSPSAAPGMLVVAPCWGPMYVFKDDTL